MNFLEQVILQNIAGDVSSPVNGGLWYNTSTNKYRGYQNGSLVDLISAGGGGALSAITAATTTNTINNTNYLQEWQWNTLAGGTGLKLSASTTLAASNTQKILHLSLSGANATSNQTTTTAVFENTHTGTGSTNVAIVATASGGTNNKSAIFNGNIDVLGDIYLESTTTNKIVSDSSSGNISLGDVSGLGFGTLVNIDDNLQIVSITSTNLLFPFHTSIPYLGTDGSGNVISSPPPSASGASLFYINTNFS